MTQKATREHPRVSLEGLCELLGMSRSWYYEKLSLQQKAEKGVSPAGK